MAAVAGIANALMAMEPVASDRWMNDAADATKGRDQVGEGLLLAGLAEIAWLFEPLDRPERFLDSSEG